MDHPASKSRPDAFSTRTPPPDQSPPSIAPKHIETGKQFSTLRAELALRGYSVAQEYVIRRHGQQPAIAASIEALTAFVRGVL